MRKQYLDVPVFPSAIELFAMFVGAAVTYKVVKMWQYDNHRPMIQFAKENYPYPLRVAEIGVLWGTNCRRMFNNLDVETIYLIDPFSKYEGYDWEEVVILPDSFDHALSIIGEYADCVVPLQMTSEEAASYVPNDLDMVYVDGNHAYDYVKKDIELYAPKVKQGGLIGGHDITGSKMSPDVQQAVYEFADAHNLPVYVDCPDWWIIL